MSLRNALKKNFKLQNGENKSGLNIFVTCRLETNTSKNICMKCTSFHMRCSVATSGLCMLKEPKRGVALSLKTLLKWN